jgi:small subunit ribosomal protein S20
MNYKQFASISEVIMANIKSAKKRILVNEKKAARNQMIKSAVKTEIKKVRTAIEAGNKEEAAKALLAATSAIDKAESKGVFKKNTASRKVSRLAQAVNKMA